VLEETPITRRPTPIHQERVAIAEGGPLGYTESSDDARRFSGLSGDCRGVDLMTVLQIAYPDELLSVVEQGQEGLEALAREALVVRLFDLGKLSSGKAAELLGISRRDFLDLLGNYNVSIFDEEMNLEEETRRALAARGVEHNAPDRPGGRGPA
jgi:predicted HTH domain antitoxin